jgi:hypothetical protein
VTGMFIAPLLAATLLAATPQPPQLKAIHPDTPLTGAWIVAPPRYQHDAERLRQAIESQCGIDVPIHQPAADIGNERTLIVLGNLMTNEVAAELYRKRLIISDAHRPGAGGHELRTVHDPWATGHNAIFAGGSDDDSVTRAVDRLIEQLPDSPVVARLHDVSLNGNPPKRSQVTDADLAAIAELAFRPTGSMITGAAMDLFLHDDPGAKQRFLAAMRRLGAHLAQRRDQPVDHAWQFDQRSMVEIAPLWDAVEEAGFTDAERAEVTAILFETIWQSQAGLHTGSGEMGMPHGNQWNIRATGNLLHYFNTYYDVDFGELGRTVDDFFVNQAQAWKFREDCPSYGAITWWDLLNYELLTGKTGWLESEKLRQAADYALMIVDNRGATAGFGDTSSHSSAGYLPYLLNIAAHLTGDGRYRVFADRFGPVGGATASGNLYNIDLPPQVPSDLVGVAHAPIDDWIVEYRMEDLGTVDAYRDLLASKPLPPRDRLFDKLSMRDGFDRDDPYVLLGGLNHGYHAHPDAGAIIDYSDRGLLWIFDNGYFVPERAEHATVCVYRDGFAEPAPRFAALNFAEDSETHGFAQIETQNYNGTTWTRTIVWWRPRGFFVIDRVTADEPGEIGAQCIWRVIGEPHKDDANQRVLVEQAGCALSLSSATDARWKWLPTVPASDMRHSLRQSQSRRLGRGESLVFLNAFTTIAGSSEHPWQVESLADNAMRVTPIDGEAAIIGSGTFRLGELYVKAEAFDLSPERSVAAGLTFVRIGDWTGRTASQLASMPQQVREQLRRIIAEATAAKHATAGDDDVEIPTLDPVWLRSNARTTTERYYRTADGKTVDNIAMAGRAVAWEPTNAGCRPGNATDGQFDTYAAVGSGSSHTNTPPKDLGVEWPTPRSVGQVVVTFYDAGYAPALDGWAIEIWRDDAWHAIEVDLEIEDDATWRFTLREPVITTRVRVIVHEFNTYRTAIREFEVYEAAVTSGTETFATGRETRDLTLARFDGDGEVSPVIVLKRGIVAYDSQGEIRFERDFDRDIHTAIAANDALIVAAGRELFAIDGEGEIIWQVDSPADAYSPDIDPASGNLVELHAVDVDGDGVEEIAAGSSNWFAYLFSADGSLRWRALSWAHPTQDIGSGDLTGDGKPELIYATRYNDGNVFDRTGKQLGAVAGGYHSTPQQALIADLGRGPRAIIGTRTGTIHFAAADFQEQVKLNPGASIIRMIVAPGTPGSGPLLVAASENFYLYGIDADGRVQWLHMLGDVARDLVAVDNRIAVIADGGELLLLDRSGGVIARSSLPGAGYRAAVTGKTLYVATGDGQLLRFDVE